MEMYLTLFIFRASRIHLGMLVQQTDCFCSSYDDIFAAELNLCTCGRTFPVDFKYNEGILDNSCSGFKHRVYACGSVVSLAYIFYSVAFFKMFADTKLHFTLVPYV